MRPPRRLADTDRREEAGASAPRAPRLPEALALLLVAIGTVGLLLPGGALPTGVLGGDAHSHLARTWLWARSLEAGEAPVWSNAWYAGFPLHRYYGPLYPAVTAALAELVARLGAADTPGAVDAAAAARATGLWLWGAGLLGAIAAGRLARPGAARAVAMGVAGLIPLSLAAITQAGLLPLSLVHPLTAVALGGVLAGGRRGAAVAALGLAGVTAAHTQYGILLAGLLLVAAIAGKPPGSVTDRVLGIALAAGLTAWLVVPGIALRDAVALGASSSTETFWDPDATVAGSLALLRWAREGDGWIVHYAGLTTLALAAVGATSPRLRPHAAIVVLAVLAAPAQPRLLQLAVPSLAVLAGEGLAALRPNARWVALAALLLDVGSTVAPVRWRPIPEVPGAAGRTLVLADGRSAFWRSLDPLAAPSSPPSSGAAPTAALGGLPQLATPVLASLVGAQARAAREALADPDAPWSPELAASLRTLGIDTVADLSTDAARPVPGASRAWFATVALPADALPLPDWRVLRDGVADHDAPALPLDLVALDADLPVARGVLIPGAPPPDGEAPLATFTVVSADESPATVTVRYRSDRDGWLRLTAAAFPGHHVTIDGAEAPWQATAAGFVAVPAPAGEHVVHLRPGLLGWEVGLLALGAASLVVATALAARR